MEKYIRVSDIKKVFDPYRDWDVPQMTADEVVGIVRCRECKYKAEGQGYCYKNGIWLHRITFCSVGERRES
jgi:hypothetical protein